jgi:hypothetical protein
MIEASRVIGYVAADKVADRSRAKRAMHLPGKLNRTLSVQLCMAPDGVQYR